jgi:hypothetical protein
VNRSFTYPEIEVVRAFNRTYKSVAGSEVYHRSLRLGAFRTVGAREPSADEPRIQLPGWAADPIARRQREIVSAIAASGVRVVGDVEQLAEPPKAPPPGTPPPDPRAAPELTAAFMAGVLYGSGLLPDDGQSGLPGPVVGPEVWAIPAKRLMRALAVRGAKRVIKITRGLSKRLGGSMAQVGHRG